MIIVSQNGDIVNYENIVEIYKTFGHKKNIQIEAETVNNDFITLGEYATEKRAKEVLEEIIKAYIESKEAQEITTIFGFSIIPSNTYYEMPKE